MITVLTATYNRGYTLPRLYESLEQQGNKSFEWVVVDDGSVDETLSLLEQYQKKASFPIRILPQANAGKHIAINTGVSAAKGDWVFIVDSDDLLPINGIETIMSDLQDDDAENRVGYCYRKADLKGILIGNAIPEAAADSAEMTPTQAGSLYRGDLAYIFRRSVLLKYPFPSFKGEVFVPELLIWNKISDDGSVLFFHHKIIYLCEYLADGYSANFYKNLRRNPQGFGCFYKDQIYRETSLIRKVKCLVRYAQCCVFRFRHRRMV